MKRQQAVHRRLVGADDHPAAPDLLQLPDGRFGVGGQAEEPLRVVLQQPAGLGQRAVADERSNSRSPSSSSSRRMRLADGGLGPVQLLRRGRETALRWQR